MRSSVNVLEIFFQTCTIISAVLLQIYNIILAIFVKIDSCLSGFLK